MPFAGLHLVSLLFHIFALSVPLQCTVALVVREPPFFTLPVTRRFNMTGTANLVQLDQARAKALLARSQAVSSMNGTTGVPAVNQYVNYAVTIGVGTPPNNYSLLVDTGSSNTWVGAQLLNPYKETSSSKPTGDIVEVTYGSGFFLGNEFNDTVTIAPGVVIENQGIGAATVSKGFKQVDGILGIGPVDLTEGTLAGPNTMSEIPTVRDNLFKQGTVEENKVGICFFPTTSGNLTDGVITFGGVDSTNFKEPLYYVPITSTAPANRYVGIDQSITYGSPGTPVLPTTAGIVDTGTTLTLIASDAFATYQNVTGGVPDSTTGLLTITPAQFANLQSLWFHIGNSSYELTPNAQIWPRSLNTAIGGTAGTIYLIVNSLGSSSGHGLDFINGMTFLQRFYHAYDATNNRAGFATTDFTNATTN